MRACGNRLVLDMSPEPTNAPRQKWGDYQPKDPPSPRREDGAQVRSRGEMNREEEMQYRIAIEVSKVDGCIPAELIVKSYRYSRYGAVAIILNDITPKCVDQVLDPVVAKLGLYSPGVRYIDIGENAAVIRVLSSAKMIIAISPTFFERSRVYGQTMERKWPRYRSIVTSLPKDGHLPLIVERRFSREVLL
jgi:hypothetical protein